MTGSFIGVCTILPEHMSAQECPYCPNEGYSVVPNRYTGEPEQEQCEFCYTVPTSIFNLNNNKDQHESTYK